jgi:hypothetical protein
MRLMTPPGSFTSMLESQPQPIADPERHVQTWKQVLAWDLAAWTTSHDPPGVGGPPWSGDAIKQAIRESLARTGEDDPTGARLKWNRKRSG